MKHNHSFKNFCALTVTIGKVAVKDGKNGRYAHAAATASLGSEIVPLKVIAYDENIIPALVEGATLTVVGRLGYEEWEGQKGKFARLTLTAEKLDSPTEDGRPRNVVKITLKGIADPFCSYSSAGRFWGRIRAMLSMGKTADGSGWKPALFLDVKAFAKSSPAEGEDPDALPTELGNLTRGSYFTVVGQLAAETYNEVLRYSVIARKFEAVVFDTAPESVEAEAALEEVL